MNTKLFELRDRATFVPVLAVRLDGPHSDAERYLLRRCGYGLDRIHPPPDVVLWRLNGGPACADPYDWRDRTLTVAHAHIVGHRDELESGAVVDVEHLLGEADAPKVSERVEAPL